MTDQIVDLIEPYVSVSSDVQSTAEGIARQVSEDTVSECIKSPEIIPAYVNLIADFNVAGYIRCGTLTSPTFSHGEYTRAGLPAVRYYFDPLEVDRNLPIGDKNGKQLHYDGDCGNATLYICSQANVPNVATIEYWCYDKNNKKTTFIKYLGDMQYGVTIPDGTTRLEFRYLRLSYSSFVANGGTTAYETLLFGFTLVPDGMDYMKASDSIPGRPMTLPFPNLIWTCRPDIGYALPGVWLDYLYNGCEKKDRIYFAGKGSLIDHWVPHDDPKNGNTNPDNVDILVTTRSLELGCETKRYNPITFNEVRVSNRTQPKPIRMLIIGDSVTAGAVTSETYWQLLAKMLIRDDIASGRWDDEHTRTDFMLLGTHCDGESGVKTVNDDFGGVSYSKQIAVCAQSGSKLNDWRTNDAYGFADNGKFSIKHWISCYRTYADDGERLQIGDGTGSRVTEANQDNYICATPNVVYLNLTHNGFDVSQYEQTIDDIRSEYPDMPILVGVGMPLLGSWWSELYADEYAYPRNLVIGPQYSWGGTYGSKRLAAMTTFCDVERGLASANGKTYTGVWYVPQPVVTPTVQAFEMTEDRVDAGVAMRQKGTTASMPREHPGRSAHLAWAIQLHGIIGWIFRNDAATTNISASNPLMPNH